MMKFSLVSLNDRFIPYIISEMQKYHSVKIYEHQENQAINCFNLGIISEWSDVIFVDFAQPPLDIVSLRGDRNIIVRLHRHEVYNNFILNNVNWSNIHTVIFDSPQIKDKFLSVINFPDDKIYTVSPVMVDTKLFSFERRENNVFNFCMLGDVRKRKRVYDFVSFFKDFYSNHEYDVHLNIIGRWVDGEYITQIKELVKNLKLKKRVHFLNELHTQKELIPVLKKQDIIISHSREETGHQGIWEAMSTGCYPLVHNWSGASFFFPKSYIYSGYKELEKKMVKFLEAPKVEKLHLSTKARMEALKFEAVERVQIFREIFERVFVSDRPNNLYNIFVYKLIEKVRSDEGKQSYRKAKKYLSKYIQEGDRVLDVGCGIGYLTDFMTTKLKAICTGIDVAYECIEYARKNYKGKFRTGNITGEDYQEKFDVFVFNETLEHISKEEWGAIFKKMDFYGNSNSRIIINARKKILPKDFSVELVWEDVLLLKEELLQLAAQHKWNIILDLTEERDFIKMCLVKEVK